jgi:hypothetical protein
MAFEWLHMIELCALGEQNNTTNKCLVISNKHRIELCVLLVSTWLP